MIPSEVQPSSRRRLEFTDNHWRPLLLCDARVHAQSGATSRSLCNPFATCYALRRLSGVGSGPLRGRISFALCRGMRATEPANASPAFSDRDAAAAPNTGSVASATAILRRWPCAGSSPSVHLLHAFWAPCVWRVCQCRRHSSWKKRARPAANAVAPAF